MTEDRKPVLVSVGGEPREGFTSLTVSDFLLSTRSHMGTSGAIFASCIEGRLAAAMRGPILLGDVQHPRFEKVGWPKAPETSTTDELLAMGGAAWPNIDKVHAQKLGIGSLKPKLVIVTKGARLSTIFKAIQFKGYDELEWFLVKLPTKWDERNIAWIRRLQALNEAFGTNPKYLAFGKDAKEAVARAQLPHVWVKHPDEPGTANKEFKMLGRELGRQGLDNGPWRDIECPSTHTTTFPEWVGMLGVKLNVKNKFKTGTKQDEVKLYVGPNKTALPTNTYHLDLVREATAASCTPEEFGEMVHRMKEKALEGDIRAFEAIVKLKLALWTDTSKQTNYNVQINNAIMESQAIRDNLSDPDKAKAAYDLMNLLMPPTGGPPQGRTIDIQPEPRQE